MQHLCVRCQSLQAATHASATPHLAQSETVPLIKNASDQQISTTCSRRLRRPEDFIDAVKWAVKYHPKANDTTLAVAHDLAASMPASKEGHVAYALGTRHQRLGLARSTVAEHVAILRELGLLAWVEHGCLRNALRTRLGHRFAAGVGYRPTATIYAPCAPPEYDRAHGQLRDGTGYRSRIRAYTPQGRLQAIANTRARSARRTPSLITRTPYSPTGRREGRKDNAARPPRAATPSPHSARSTTGFTPRQAAAGITHAQRVRLEIWWTQGTCLRQLGYALRPLILAGYTWQDTARELARWHVRTRPASAPALIRAELRGRAHAGELHLPEGSVKPFRHAPADETGHRHRSMIQRKWEQYGPAFARYRQSLAAPLRTALQQLTSPLAPQPPRPRPQLREPEHLFHRACSTQRDARDVYRSRAWALPDRPTPPPAFTGAEGQRLWAELAEHARAAAAFQRLREHLANTADTGMSTWGSPLRCG
ncbi:hypothetical protein [Streptomyces sp. NEAU-S7GS2]|uniref:hypothetical protein n=1 Tax=Streptomyces sp. NEAU-S7GS2 TaxID=2202000 RepID=UPI000D6EDCED|nr:hypothetical protein [Streptomyces sp. NEAU-S7GS2]AWN24866.1 hypothetical protein DKG71_00565 [Streptomyces sp. NEAU-S7GS2]